MSENLDTYTSRAVNSNLTATAVEFVPRSEMSYYSRAGPSNENYNNGYRNDRRGQNQYSRSDDYNNRQEMWYRGPDQYGRRTHFSDRQGDYFDRHSHTNNYRPQESRSNFYNRNDFRNVDQRQKNQSNGAVFNDMKLNFSKRHTERELENGSQNREESYLDFNGDRSNNHQYRKFRPRTNNFERTSFNHDENYAADTSNFDIRSYKQNNVYSKNKSWNRGNSGKTNNEKVELPSGDDSDCQRDRLIEQLNKGVHECLICCEAIKQREPVWNCSNCYYVLHMWCVIKWARSSTAESSCWRCPACQFQYVQIPEKYMCFCSKSKLQTEWNRADTAHSCGEVCGRNGENPTPWFMCEHRCTLLCHPGPCPPCLIQITRECGCGRTQRTVQCSTKSEILCGTICDRLLNCGVHRCAKICHFGDCGSCGTEIEIDCFCGKKTSLVTCGANETQRSTCEQKCQRQLSCGNHSCDSLCHPGECGLCPRAPIVLNTCMCGKTSLTENSRQSCLDEVPVCGQVCGKALKCGPANKRHMCAQKCHDGECGNCDKKTIIKCRCGALERKIPCCELNSKEADFRCQKKCSKKRGCGKHKCNQVCCIDVEHICSQRCNCSLSCGKHRCELLCHRGKCGRCLQSSFEELYCHCGHSVIYPPVPCGTRPPECDQPCRRQHDCDHPPLHACHSDDTCPPCTVFTDKLCYGGHELRKTIPCYQKEFSCGMPCGAPLPCGFHKCQTACHGGDCLSSSKKCSQACTKSRNICGHPCTAPCHTGACPETLCRAAVTVTCGCGNTVATHQCCEHTDDYRRVIAATLAAKMSELQLSNSVNIGDVSEKISAQTINLRTLECTDECKFLMRNRRLALALQIQNPDLSAKLTPRYSDLMKSWAKKDANLCRHIHDKLTALVKLAKESKQKSRSFSFEVMNKDKRQLVHEYCVHFGCDSEAYDAEPKRNVVAIATKGKCWLPAYSLMEVVQREMGQRKVPGPVINKRTSSKEEHDVQQRIGTRIILPVMPSANSSHAGINYFGD